MINMLDQTRFNDWDSYITSSENSTFFHMSGWKKIVEDALGHDVHYYYYEQEGKIKGVLPLTHVKSMLFGNALISSAFCVYGGIVADNQQIFDELDQFACQLADKLGVDYLEFRYKSVQVQDRPRKQLYVTFRKDMYEDVERNMQSIPRKQRAMIRYGIEVGLTSQVDLDVDDFYFLYSQSVRNLGTPVLPKKYFQVLKDVFGDNCEILTVKDRDGNSISSVMSFYFKDEILPYYGGGGPLARQLKANDFMYWEVMKRAVNRGVKIFDFGRSKEGTGSYRFKKHWGFEPQALSYEYYLVKTDNIPDVNPLNPKYQYFIAAWKKLPLVVSQVVGPFLAKNLG